MYEYCSQFGPVHSVYMVMDVDDLVKIRHQLDEIDIEYSTAMSRHEVCDTCYDMTSERRQTSQDSQKKGQN